MKNSTKPMKYVTYSLIASLHKKTFFTLILFFLCFGISANAEQGKITEREIFQAQKGWGEGIVSIGQLYTEGGDYTSFAEEFLDTFYGYNEGPVLFKPTKASTTQFRPTRKEALSYFVTGSVDEDHGFALNPWSQVRFENAGITIYQDTALAMGNYYFTDATTSEVVKVEYTFGYFKDAKGNLRIMAHHSSIPYEKSH